VKKDGPDKIKVMIADDHPIMRVGLRLTVRRERDMELVGETKDARATIEEFQRVLPDVIILNLDSLNRRGPDTFETIRRACPNLPLIVLSSYPIETNKRLEHPGPGFIMFLLKSCSSEEIIAALRAVVTNSRRQQQSRPP
jgi:DNA-binding NarL/FixJ family response regulator